MIELMSADVKAILSPLAFVVVILLVFGLASYGDITQSEFDAFMDKEHIQNAKMINSNVFANACGFYHEAFQGTKDGVPVTGIVCKGIFRGLTVKY
jgi:hypothetical protein